MHTLYHPRDLLCPKDHCLIHFDGTYEELARVHFFLSWQTLVLGFQ